MLALEKEATMTLTRRDLGATVLAALVVLIYVANVQGWWYLGSNRWAAVTMLAIGAISCPLGARIDEIEKGVTTPIVLLGLLGVTALVLGLIAIVTAAQWALSALAIVLIVLWAGTTLRHATTQPRPIAAH
jgi:FtsH-binding integral membrane protein